MYKDEECSIWAENHQAEDLSAKMARKSKPIPPPLNLSAMGDSDASNSPLKDFAMLATSPRSPLVQKNLPFRKRAHSYSSTQTSSECDSPDSPRVPASPIAAAPSPSPFTKSPVSSPNHLFNKRFLQEPIKSLLPSPNTSASFFNNECDPIKSPCLNFYRPVPELQPMPMMEKNSLKSPLQTPTRSVFLQNHLPDSTLFFTEAEKLHMKSPLNTPTPRSISHAINNNDGVFVMPEPISVKTEPAEPEKENHGKFEIKAEPMNGDIYQEPPLDLACSYSDLGIKCEPADSPEPDRSHDYANCYIDPKLFESLNCKMNKGYYMPPNFARCCAEMTAPVAPSYPEPPRGKPMAYHKPQTTYRKTSTPKRPSDKTEDELAKKSKKDDDERPRRPMNAFMLFAKHQRPLLIQQHPGKDNRAISVVLGTAWRELDASERADYVQRAAAMAIEHKRRHPDCWKRRRVRPNNAAAAAPAQDVLTSTS